MATTGLTNPNLVYKGLSIPDNRFEMKKRFLETIDGVTRVKFILVCYTLADKSQELPFPIEFNLIGLAASPSVQDYWDQLMVQHGTETMPDFEDLTQIKDYTVLTD